MKEDLLKIIKHYGIDKQLKYIHSEYYELDESVFEYESGKYLADIDYEEKEQVAEEHIAEEIADVMVMLKQFQYYYDIEDSEIEDIMKKKIKRQLERIEDEKAIDNFINTGEEFLNDFLNKKTNEEGE